MEWLEFERWSPEVSHRLALQAARLRNTVAARPVTGARQVDGAATRQARNLQQLLRDYPRSNPWGHPTLEC